MPTYQENYPTMFLRFISISVFPIACTREVKKILFKTLTLIYD